MKKYGYYGYIDKTGTEVLPCEYLTVHDFKEELALVEIEQRARHGGWCPTKLCFIDINGKIQEQLLGTYRIPCTSYFHNGFAPIELYGSYSEACGSYDMIDAYIDKEGKVYSKNLSDIEHYYKCSFPLVKQPEIDPNKLVYYCSEVSFLGAKVVLKANSELELIQKKKALCVEIRASITSFEETLTSEEDKLNTTSKPKVYQLEDNK